MQRTKTNTKILAKRDGSSISFQATSIFAGAAPLGQPIFLR